MTNLWIGIEPSELCQQHLLGLHKELHQETGTLENHPHGEAIVQGHWKLGQVSTDKIQERHDEVVEEMEKRGMNHDSPLDYTDEYGLHSWLIGLPFEQIQRAVLSQRCSECQV